MNPKATPPQHEPQPHFRWSPRVARIQPPFLARPHIFSPRIIMSTALDVTESTWESTVLQSETPVLVDFWAPWCGPCKAMGPYVDKLAEEYAGRLSVVKLDTQDNPEVAARYGITGIPAFVLIKGGEVVAQAMGSMQYAALKETVDPHL